MTEPTDPELLALIEKHLGLKPRRDDTVIDPRTGRFTDVQRYRDFTRAVLAKWGTPRAVAPWRSAVLDLIDDCPGLPLEQDRWLSRRVKELDFASTPQPTQAQAGAVPLTADELKEPRNGKHWHVEWWNESCRMMLPTNKRIDSFQSYKNGTLMFTIKETKGADHG